MFEFKDEHMEEPAAKGYCPVFDECSSPDIGFLVWVLLLEFEAWSRERREKLLDDILCIPCVVDVCYILCACTCEEPKHHNSNRVGFHQQPQYRCSAGSGFEPNSGTQSASTYRNRSRGIQSF